MTRPVQLDVTVGDIRVVVAPTGLIGLHRDQAGEHLTLIGSEAVTVARVLLDHLAAMMPPPAPVRPTAEPEPEATEAPVHDGYPITGRDHHGDGADEAHQRVVDALQRKGSADRAAGLTTCPRCGSQGGAAALGMTDMHGLLRVKVCSWCAAWLEQHPHRQAGWTA